ncbi:HAMP domain-containing histidine kinase [Hoeflea sp. WL0058]|uniref:histidine kinase n=1 Tax=Flavimaribacter sediminis TaxID=2865987 RepID=A0AAE2ZNK1_9HYPH|nr:HAMP domain-containing sensor histidine kinase [Flavimaribacter sediminis]MBW8638010.1 HAMP domain-containing histidine kinase [Flavimaribacter sediminis]
MRLGDIFSGSAFRTALAALLLFALTLLAAGWSSYVAVRGAMLSELNQQLTEETLLFTKIYRDEGADGLIDLITQLEVAEIGDERYAAIFDESNNRLAGNIDLAPDFVGIREDRSIIRAVGEDRVYTRWFMIDRYQIVIGRNTHVVDLALDVLRAWLLLAGVFSLAGSLLIGWLYSHRSMVKLQRIAVALERVSRGEISARVQPIAGNDQIDRISHLINQSLDRLSALTASSQNTVRAIAHDLRTPLNRVFITVQDAIASPNNAAALLEEIETELQRLGAIFDTVLRISSLDNTRDASAFTAIDLSGVAREVAEVFKETLEDKGQRLTLDLSEDVTVSGDAQMLKQLLVNLLTNAHQYAPENSPIGVSTRHDAGGDVLEVTDKGMGIPPEHREQVLQPFFRLDKSRSEAGNGLGLALVQAVCVRHNATISLEDNDPGLRIVIRFPLV